LRTDISVGSAGVAVFVEDVSGVELMIFSL
jgi:hypothetical protein